MGLPKELNDRIKHIKRLKPYIDVNIEDVTQPRLFIAIGKEHIILPHDTSKM